MPRPFLYQIIVYSLASAILIPAFLGITIPMVFSHQVHKALHLLGVILFLGHNTVSLFWGGQANRSKDPALIRFSIKTFTWADLYFTAGGLFLILANGVLLAAPLGGLYEQPWILSTLIVLGLSSVPLLVSCHRKSASGSWPAVSTMTKLYSRELSIVRCSI